MVTLSSASIVLDDGRLRMKPGMVRLLSCQHEATWVGWLASWSDAVQPFCENETAIALHRYPWELAADPYPKVPNQYVPLGRTLVLWRHWVAGSQRSYCFRRNLFLTAKYFSSLLHPRLSTFLDSEMQGDRPSMKEKCVRRSNNGRSTKELM